MSTLNPLLDSERLADSARYRDQHDRFVAECEYLVAASSEELAKTVLESPTAQFLAAFPSIYGPESQKAVKSRLWPTLCAERDHLNAIYNHTLEVLARRDAAAIAADLLHDEATEAHSYQSSKQNYHD